MIRIWSTHFYDMLNRYWIDNLKLKKNCHLKHALWKLFYVVRFFVNSQAVGWDSWVPLALKSIFWGDLIFESVAWFFVIILKLILTAIFEIKIHGKNPLTLKNFIFESLWVKFFDIFESLNSEIDPCLKLSSERKPKLNWIIIAKSVFISGRKNSSAPSFLKGGIIKTSNNLVNKARSGQNWFEINILGLVS